MISIKDNYKFGTDPTMEDQIIGFISPKKSMAQRIEALSFYGSRWTLSEDSGFKYYPSRLKVYLVKNMVR